MSGAGWSCCRADSPAAGAMPGKPGMNRARGLVLAAAALGAGLAVVYVRVVRPRALRWGLPTRRRPGRCQVMGL